MKKKIVTILIAVLAGILLCVFVYSGYRILSSKQEYAESKELYDDAVTRYTTVNDNPSSVQPEKEMSGTEGSENSPDVPDPEAEEDSDAAPIRVDFDALKKVNPDIVGWIYCEDTVINYPVVQGENNEYYLKKGYDRKYSFTGSIFLDSRASPDFSDANNIIYGHNMMDASMFAGLEKWKDQAYYEEHPVMWLLTPGGDYRIRIFSGYLTDARSEAFSIIPANGSFLQKYLDKALAKSDIRTDHAPDGTGKYVMLSTCAYDYKTARYVLHGEMERIGPDGTE